MDNREFKFRALKDLGVLKLMLDGVSVLSEHRENSVGLYLEHFKEELESTGWKLSEDQDDLINEKTGEKINLYKNGILYTDEYFIVEDCIIMQFTGFKDKNSKEIYEGDFLKRHHSFCEVRWIDAGFNFVNKRNWLDDWNWADDASKSIVVGNTHQNPELL